MLLADILVICWFVIPHRVIKFGLMMFCELIYHFIKTESSFTYQQWF